MTTSSRLIFCSVARKLCFCYLIVLHMCHIERVQTGPLGWAGGRFRTAALGSVEMIEHPEAALRPAQGAHLHTSQPSATPKNLWSEPKQFLIQRLFWATCATPQWLQSGPSTCGQATEWMRPLLAIATAVWGGEGKVSGRPLLCMPGVAHFGPLQHGPFHGPFDHSHRVSLGLARQPL